MLTRALTVITFILDLYSIVVYSISMNKRPPCLATALRHGELLPPDTPITAVEYDDSLREEVLNKMIPGYSDRIRRRSRASSVTGDNKADVSVETVSKQVVDRQANHQSVSL